jgi:hypothetical protein
MAACSREMNEENNPKADRFAPGSRSAKAMFRLIRIAGFGSECVEGDRPLFRRKLSGAIEEVEGPRRIKRTGGFWNAYVYEFSGETPGRLRPPEPRLTWRLAGFFREESIESDGFSGVVSRERILDQVIIRAANFEWRFDRAQSELYFEPPAPDVELRITLLAFLFFEGCMPA